MKKAFPVTFAAWLAGGFLAAAGPASTEQASSPEAKRAISAATGQALQGNMRRALAELNTIPFSQFGTKDGHVRSCMIECFEAGADGSLPTEFGPFSNRAIGIYRAYWRASLLHPESRALEEKRLHRNLARLTGLPTEAEQSRIREEVKERFGREGFQALTGRTSPLLELILWGKEVKELRNVPLPEGRYEVTVNILDDFASLGWSAYATCDRSFTGGWVQPDAVYAVRPGWKSLEDENFRISFLAHETQHFADKKRFPNLDSWELEYRAKLAELALADTTIPRLLSVFATNQGDDAIVPHSYANKRVLINLQRQLGLRATSELNAIHVKTINEGARALLLTDSAQRAGGSSKGQPAAPRPKAATGP